MSTGLTRITKEFNKMKKPWALTGDFGLTMHSYYTGGREPKPVKEYRIAIKNSNFQTFHNKLTSMDYKWKHIHSTRNAHKFEKTGQSDIILILQANSPKIVRYEYHPVHSLIELKTPNKKRLQRIAGQRMMLDNSVWRIMRNVSLN
jgi:hypothetical protein